MKEISLLSKGSVAPDFEVNDENGQSVRLSDYRGKKVVLYFYPNDDTPTCTKEACNFRDNLALLKKENYVVLGVSDDDEKSHTKFIAKYDLPFRLLADVDHKIIDAYGVYGRKLFMGRELETTHRITYIIDEEGKIAEVIEKVKSGEAVQQILTLMNDK